MAYGQPAGGSQMKLNAEQLKKIAEYREFCLNYWHSGVLDVASIEGVLLSHGTFCDTFDEFEIGAFQGAHFNSIISAVHDGVRYFSVYKQEGETH